jgi:hypothetical protein
MEPTGHTRIYQQLIWKLDIQFLTTIIPGH